MAKFQAYPTYVSSGLKWLGDLPVGWKTERAKLIFNEINERSKDGAEQLLSVSEYFGVKPRSEVIEEGEYLSRAESLEGYKKCQINDLVMNIMLAWKRGLAFTQFAGIVSPAYSVFRLKKQYDPGYLNYLLRTDLYTHLFKRWSTGVIDSRLRLYPEIFGALPVVVPPRPEQTAITAFLDHETAKIDRLIVRQKRLIELLKEKRQAVISHAVTKGLNPDAPMKDSGVEWLGEVPAHWIVSRIKFVTRGIIDGPHFSPSYVDDGILFISARNIKEDRWSFDDAKYVTEEDYIEFCKRVKPVKGDVLLTKGGTTGVARAVDFDKPFQVWVHIAVLKTVHAKVDPFFFAHALNGKPCYEQSQLYTRGATNNDLGLSRIANIYFCLPDPIEQKQIVDRLHQLIGKIDTLIERARRQIDLLLEHRAALISAAVTGKIDVRSWQKPNAEPQAAATAASA